MAEQVKEIRNRRMKSLRNSLGLKQKEFAHSVGVSEGLISKVEKGAIPVTDKLITKVALEYNINPEWIKGISEDLENTEAIYDSQQIRRLICGFGENRENRELESRARQMQLLEASLKDVSGMSDGMAQEYLKSVNCCLEKLHMYIFYLKHMDENRDLALCLDDLELGVMDSMKTLKNLFVTLHG